MQRVALWTSVRVRPGWVVRPPRFVQIEPSDNVDMLRRLWADPLGLKTNEIGQVHGVVSPMENAHRAASDLPAEVPTLLTYGAVSSVWQRWPSEFRRLTMGVGNASVANCHPSWWC